VTAWYALSYVELACGDLLQLNPLNNIANVPVFICVIPGEPFSLVTLPPDFPE
jgi:hypothetical protein